MRTLLAAFVVIAVAPTFAQQPDRSRHVDAARRRGHGQRRPTGARARGRPSEVASTERCRSSLERAVLTDDRGQFTVRVPAADVRSPRIHKARYTTRLPTSRAAGTGCPSVGDARADVARRSDQRPGPRSVRRSGDEAIDHSCEVIGACVLIGPAEVSATTDDLGEFRFGGLAEGTYADYGATVRCSRSTPCGPPGGMMRRRRRARPSASVSAPKSANIDVTSTRRPNWSGRGVDRDRTLILTRPGRCADASSAREVLRSLVPWCTRIARGSRPRPWKLTHAAAM